MDVELDQRTYDLLRLVDRHGPIGSIQLVELMQQRGYDIKDRTIRLQLSELDDLGLTEKVPGRGRRLTESGRQELDQGDVSGRLEQIRAQISMLTSRVSYDPMEDSGALVASSAFVDDDDLNEALDVIRRLEALPLGPLPVAVEPAADGEPGDHRILASSSITLDGVLLAHGINVDLLTAGVLEYVASEDDTVDDHTSVSDADLGGHIWRFVDVINGEGSSIDVISLLIEADRSDVTSLLDTERRGLLIGDDRQFPVNRFEEARDLSLATRSALGGVIDLRRPREDTTFSSGTPAWAFGSLTYAGAGELVIAALHEQGLATDWETLYGTVARNRLEAVDALRPTVADD